MRRTIWSLVSACAVVCALLGDRRADAQASEKAAAEALFQAGRVLFEQHQLAEACAKFEASQRLDPALGTMLHLADCYERTGRTASAWALFEEAASLARVSGQSGREEIARVRSQALAPRLSRLEIRVSRAMAGLTLDIGAMPVPAASWGHAIPVDPGEHVVRASAPGHATWTSTVRIEHDQSEPASLEVPVLQPVRAASTAIVGPPTAVVAPEPAIDGAQRTIGLVIGSAGLTTLAIGTVLGALAIVDNDRSLEACRPDDPTLCSRAGVDLREAAGRYALGSTISFAVGGGLLATGLIVYLTAPSQRSEQALRARLLATHDAAGLAFGGAW